MNHKNLAFTSALTQASLIQKKDITPLDLVEIYLDRITNIDHQLGSYFYVAGEMAIAAAREKTEFLGTRSTAEIAELANLQPFFGVPIAIKDLNPVLGMPCSYGVGALRQNMATMDDGVVLRLKQAGFIPLGKTATSELGSFPYSEPAGFPPSRNPWHLDYSSGGSSGGSAAAVAAGLASLAQGSDAGGSIRGPAFCCGVVGIKPSRGRVSWYPVGDRQGGISTNGPIARNVADAAALLDVMAGYVTGDPYWLPKSPRSFFEATQEQAKDQLPRLKIAYTTTVELIGSTTPEIAEAVMATSQQLETMGHNLELACPDFTGLVEPFTKIWQAGVASVPMPTQILSPMNQWIASQAGTAGEYLQALAQMQIIARQIVSFFDRYDALVLPVYLHPQIPIHAWAELSPEPTLEKITNWIAPCPPFNAAGLPSIALPTGVVNGLPVGVQIVGKPADEATIITLAAQLEEKLGTQQISFPDLYQADIKLV
jgi:amidase